LSKATETTSTATAKQILNRLGNGFGLTYTIIFFFSLCIYTITNPSLSLSRSRASWLIKIFKAPQTRLSFLLQKDNKQFQILESN